MIIFLYGKDSFRARQKLNEIIGHYKKIHKNGLSLKYLDSSRDDFDKAFDDFKNGLNQFSIFKEKQMAIMINPFFRSDFKEKFLKERKKLSESENIILIYEEDIKKSDTLFKFFEKYAKCQEFEALESQKLINWAKKEFEKYQAKIDTATVKKVIDCAGNDLWRLDNEIKKLVSYKNGQKITNQDVELLVKSKIGTDIFKTIEAISQKNKKLAIDLLHKHLEKGESPLYLLSMINFQFRNLAIIKHMVEKQRPYNVILAKSGLHPFVVKKSFSQAQWFTFQDLKKIYQKIFQADFDIKTGRIEPETAIDMLVAEI